MGTPKLYPTPAPEVLSNTTNDEIKVGQSASLQRTLTQQDIEIFAAASGDVNPAHLDAEYSEGTMFKGVIAHGMWNAGLISAVLGTRLPGPGVIYIGQTLNFRRPVKLGDTITAKVEVTEVIREKKRALLACTCTNQDGNLVLDGVATMLMPTGKVQRKSIKLPDIHIG